MTLVTQSLLLSFFNQTKDAFFYKIFPYFTLFLSLVVQIWESQDVYFSAHFYSIIREMKQWKKRKEGGRRKKGEGREGRKEGAYSSNSCHLRKNKGIG